MRIFKSTIIMSHCIALSLCASTSLILASASMVQAGSFCEKLAAIAKQPPTQTTLPTVLFPNSFTKPAIATDAACKTTSASQYILTCTWQFPYRATEASDQFDIVRELTESCADDPAQFTKDQNVNHPDYYEAYYFNTKGNTLSASIKDKGALQKTYVFLRMK